MKKTRLILASLTLALFSTISAQAQCNSVNYQEELCTENTLEFNTTPINLERSVLPGDAYYLHSSNAGHPWGQTTNIAAMDAVFGPGSWTQEFFESVNAGTLFSDDTSLIYIDGSDDSTIALNTFITSNQGLMETWVNEGGYLFINAGTNQGVNIPVGFGDVSIPDTANTPSVTAADATHPAFVGPLTVTTTTLTGNDYAHNSVTGSGLTSILEDTNDNTNIILAEGIFGEGYLLVGGMTTPNYHTPVTDAVNFRTNLIFMMANAPEITDCYEDETVPVIEGETYTIPDYVDEGFVTANNITSITQDPPAGTIIDSNTGTQTITFTAINDSIIEDECSFVLTVDEILGTSESAINTFSMYPNPTKSTFQIEGNFTIAVVEIYNLLGQKVIGSTSNQIDVSNIKAGMYLISVTDTEGNQASKRLIKR